MSQPWPGPHSPQPYLPPQPNTSTKGPRIITFIGIGLLVLVALVVALLLWTLANVPADGDPESYWWLGLFGAAFALPAAIPLGIAGLAMSLGGGITWSVRAQARAAYVAQPGHPDPAPGRYPPL